MISQHHFLNVFSSHFANAAFTHSVLYCFRKYSAHRRWTGAAVSGRNGRHNVRNWTQTSAFIPKCSLNLLSLVLIERHVSREATNVAAHVQKTVGSTGIGIVIHEEVAVVRQRTSNGFERMLTYWLRSDILVNNIYIWKGMVMVITIPERECIQKDRDCRD